MDEVLVHLVQNKSTTCIRNTDEIVNASTVLFCEVHLDVTT